MPDDHKIDPNLAQQELANRRKSALKQQELQKQVLNDTLISRFMAVLIENLDKRFIKNSYLKTLREKLFSTRFRRRRGRRKILAETANTEQLERRKKREDALPVSMLPSTSSSESKLGNLSTVVKPTVPLEQQPRTLGFSRFFGRSPSKNKPIDGNPRKRSRIPRPSPPQ